MKVGNSKTTDSIWYPATVPGSVHTDLYGNKLIPHPFVKDNELQLQWISETGWEYQTRFSVDEKHFKNPIIC